ncbi:hypothetical protein L2E82_44643 [Cichorium intybus]|uniref:Uncharacterized protein n=1 Tax=Cichorium intybus TaxID=13427 RepID=A0ACB8ZV74_CICIN|nr:hypothetical protein L2E82_44643 [Cichorium intybus]
MVFFFEASILVLVERVVCSVFLAEMVFLRFCVGLDVGLLVWIASRPCGRRVAKVRSGVAFGRPLVSALLVASRLKSWYSRVWGFASRPGLPSRRDRWTIWILLCFALLHVATPVSVTS